MSNRPKASGFVRVVRRALALLLFVAIPGLSTLAKVNWYLPQSDPGHYVTTATKLRVAHAPVLNTDAVESANEPLVSPNPEIAAVVTEPSETSIPRMILRAILLRRSPPSRCA